MNILPRFCELPDELADLDHAVAAVIPVPYDLTSTWKKGADQGPRAILEASHHVEWYDLATRRETCRLGIATLEAVTTDKGPEVLADLVDQRVTEVLDREVLPVVLGGEHSVSIGAIRAVARERQDVTVLQIDAHADTRESYAGSPFNHACVMARAREICDIVQVGIRAVDESEIAGLDDQRVVWAHQINGPRAQPGWVERVLGHLTDQVYVTIDLDGLDPSIVPATGTPEPGGLDWYQTFQILESVMKNRNVMGFDVVELAPINSMHAPEFIIARFIYNLFGIITRYMKTNST